MCFYYVLFFLLNKTVKCSVTPTSRIRQKDPLFSYLFILYSEVLSGLCRKAQANGSLPGLRVAKTSSRINHLLFADDTMFFCKANTQNSQSLLKILRKYETAPGQMINCKQSTITFSAKTPQKIRQRVKNDLSIPREGAVGKYLSLREHFGCRKKDLFSLIVDRIRQRSISWSSRFLSSARKMVLLKSVLSAMPTYTMSCF